MTQELQTGDNRLLRIQVNEWKGNKYINLAHMWRRDETDDWKFSKQVINVPIGLKEDFEKAFIKFLQTLEE